MEKFIGIKLVKAEPMSSKEASYKGYTGIGNKYRGEGYHVVYTNPDGSEYNSWYPKDVFERSYMNIQQTSAVDILYKVKEVLENEGGGE